MTRDYIIRIAREQGLPETAVEGVFVVNSDDLGRILAAQREEILWLLSGIDQTETEAPGGWWETSTGAKFGARILEAIRAGGQA